MKHDNQVAIRDRAYFSLLILSAINVKSFREFKFSCKGSVSHL